MLIPQLDPAFRFPSIWDVVLWAVVILSWWWLDRPGSYYCSHTDVSWGPATAFFLLAYLLTSHTPYESKTLSIERNFFFSFDLACLLVLVLHLLQTCLSLIKFRL